MYDTIIIGAGPAGLTAAIYLLRANKKVLVLESKSYGGAIINAINIENYPANPHISGYDFANNLYKQVQELGCNFIFEKVVAIKSGKIKKVITGKNEYKAHSIIIATGCISRKLELKGEDELIGKGISYCATCDGNFYKGKDVLVVGGGNTAFDDALYLSNIAKKVYLVHRRDTFKADLKTINLLKEKSNVEFILNGTITKLYGKNKLESVDITSKNKTIKINIDGLFIAIGQVPNTDMFKNVLDLDDNGYIKNKHLFTNCSGIFVAGDVRSNAIHQLVTATASGAQAGILTINYLSNR